MLPSWTPTFLLLLTSAASTTVDKTLEPGEIGEEVVIETVQLLCSKGIIGEGNNFLMRLAYVESNFGENITKSSTRGIWQFTEQEFKATRRVNETGSLFKYIKNQTNIAWRFNVTWEDLRKPLYAALAVHIYLTNGRQAFGWTRNHTKHYPIYLDSQAELRKMYYSPCRKDIDDFKFKELVQKKSLRKCTLDLVVLLDGSVSISPEDFKLAKEFVIKLFTSLMATAVNRIGLVLYSTDADVVLNLNSINRVEEINRTISEIQKPELVTETNRGLLTSLEVFQKAPPKQGVKRILVVITDGESTDNVTDVNKILDHHIIPFVVQIGNHVDKAKLIVLAGGEKSRVLQLGNYTDFVKGLQEFYSDICRDPMIASEGITYDSSMKVGDVQIYRYDMNAHNRLLQIHYQSKSANATACISFGVPIYSCTRYDQKLSLSPGNHTISVPDHHRRDTSAGSTSGASSARRKRSLHDGPEVDFDEVEFKFDDYYTDAGGYPTDDSPPDVDAQRYTVYVVVMSEIKGEYNYSLTFYETKPTVPTSTDTWDFPTISTTSLEISTGTIESPSSSTLIIALSVCGGLTVMAIIGLGGWLYFRNR